MQNIIIKIINPNNCDKRKMINHLNNDNENT